MADGSTKPIERIRKGDRVRTADEWSGEPGVGQVTCLFRREADSLLVIRTGDGQELRTTPNHPVWVEGRGFVVARRLARSELLRRADGRLVPVVSVREQRGRFVVYNLEVAGGSTYHAGRAGFWVHNTCIPGWVVDERTFAAWMKEIERNRIRHSAEEVDEIVRKAYEYRLRVRALPEDLAGHPGTAWPNPHIHIGDKEFHIPVPEGYKPPPPP